MRSTSLLCARFYRLRYCLDEITTTRGNTMDLTIFGTGDSIKIGTEFGQPIVMSLESARKLSGLLARVVENQTAKQGNYKGIMTIEEPTQ